MKTKLVVLTLGIVMLIGSFAYAFDCNRDSRSGKKVSRQALLSQLPAEKEMLFHQTMRSVREKGSEIRRQMKELRGEIKSILIADSFDEALFREKTNSLEELRSKMHDNKEEAIVILAKQFTADERAILIRLLPGKKGPGRRGLGQRGL
jgi:uncharacterized membrane protein